MRDVEDAVILAGGRGTRMLPASLYTAKEVLPLVDTPIILHLIWEAYEAGVKRIHIVHSPEKKSQFEKIINNKYYYGKDNTIERSEISNIMPRGIELTLHEQEFPGGVGDALNCVIDSLRGAFLLILGDNLLIKEHHRPDEMYEKNGSFASKKLVDEFQKNGVPCAGIKYVQDKELRKFGVVGLDEKKITDIIEKPNNEEYQSNYVMCGRYLLLEDVRDLLILYTEKEFGELQSIAILNHYINNSGLNGVILDEYDWYDSGDPISWIKAQIDHALKRDDFKDEISQFFSKLSDYL